YHQILRSDLLAHRRRSLASLRARLGHEPPHRQLQILTVIAMTLPLELTIETLTFFVAVAVIFAISDELERVSEQRRRLGELRATAASAPLLQKRASTNSFLMWVQKSSS